MRTTTWLAAVAAGALLVAGCSTSPEEAAENTAEDNAALCQSLEALQTSIDQVKAGAASAATSGDGVTVSEAQDAIGVIADGWDDVKEKASAVSDSVAEQMDMALSEYEDSLQSVDGDSTLASAAGEVKSAQENLRKSYQEILSQLGC